MTPLRLATLTCLIASSTALADEAPAGRLGVSLAWFGEMLAHPGARLGVEYDLARSGGHALVVGGGLGAWAHPGRATATFLTGDVGYRYTASKGFLVELLGHAGVMEEFLAGTAYVDGPSGFEPAGVLGNTTFIGGGTLGAGWDFSRLTRAPMALAVRLTLLEQTPVNQVAVMHVATQLALTWKF